MSIPVGVLDYRIGNLRSIGNARGKVGGGVTVVRTNEERLACDRLVLPGVGAFGASMRNLGEQGLVDAIDRYVSTGRPLLGICLGFQVLFGHGTEGGPHDGLGLVDGTVRRFETDLHVPHVGWNVLRAKAEHKLWSGLEPDAHVYFVHSFKPVEVPEEHVIGESEYDGWFCCAVARENVAGTQFHPEKSGADGLRILSNFLEWQP